MSNRLKTNQINTSTDCPHPIVTVEGITKQFPGVVANNNISLQIRCGQVHTILGENGAGKSTLMNILSGMIQPDAGKIFVNNQELKFHSPHDALSRGIGTVYQHFTLVPTLSVLENVILGTNTGFILNMQQAEQKVASLLDKFGLSISPHEEVRHLSIGEQQRVEIVKALFRGSKVLLLDEPTSVLSLAEVKELFEIVVRLKSEDVAVVFITHKLNEALEISDRLSILREGELVGEMTLQDIRETGRGKVSKQIVSLMFGRKIPQPELIPRPQKIPTSIICTLENVTALNDRGSRALQNISLDIHAGEIIGLAGVDGSGQKELGEVLAGQRHVTNGKIELDGKEITNQGASAAQKAGIGYVSDDRLGEACVPGISLAENSVMKIVDSRPFSQWTLMNRPAIEENAQRLIQTYNVKTAGPWVKMGTLSGGNIQKLLMARELAQNLKLLICNKPTYGLDVATAQFVLQTLRTQADEGAAIVLISSELDEIMEISDRIGVMFNGRILDVIDRTHADEETIGRLMLGVQP